MLLYAHGTQTDRAFNIADLDNAENAEGLLMAAMFAAHGYIVVAPEHTGNRFVDNYAFGLTGLGCGTLLIRPCRDADTKIAADRPQDIRFVLDQVLAGNASVAPAVIDASRIGMYGHSFGGYTTLTVAGGTVSGALPDRRIKAIAPLSPTASVFEFLEPGLVPLTGNIGVPTLVSFGQADKIFGIDFVDQGREIFTDLDTCAVGEKYRVEIQRGVHTGFADTCAFLAGNLEVIQQGNASPLDPINLVAFLTSDGQIPPSPPAFLGQANSGPQSICKPGLFYRPDNFAVWNAVTLLPPASPIPLSTFLFPSDQIPGEINPG
jgi:predicted dienelactone hydrolase